MKKTINLITFASVFQKQNVNAIRSGHEELFAALDSHYNVNVILGCDHDTFLDNIPTSDTNVLFIATGGTEGMVVKAYDRLPKPAVLLTDGKANSLAASLELACWIRQQNDTCRIIHGDMEHVIAELEGIQPLRGCRIGVVGQPSDWLVSSAVDYSEAQKRWGVEYIDIPLTKVEEYFAETEDGEDEAYSQFVANAEGCVEPTPADISSAVRMYHALKRLATEYRLDALTLQCFSLIPTTHTTGCLALALLNDDGIVAGCEGDLQTVFTMLLAKKATGVDGFMANPARIDTKANTIVLAHCTIGLKQVQRYIIRSHFESLSGVAIQGILPTGDVTIVKCGGKDLSRSIILTGRIVENQNDENKCRTQVLIQLDDDSSVEYFLTDNIGNHHVILQGNHRAALEKIIV